MELARSRVARVALTRVRDLWALLKIRQTALLVVTGVSAYVLTWGLPFSPLEVMWITAGLLLSVGGCTEMRRARPLVPADPPPEPVGKRFGGHTQLGRKEPSI